MKKIILIISIPVILISFVLPIILVKACNIDFTSLGVYGDFFGCFNSLVSALAFAGLIYTIFLQKKDLDLQREELRLTREELQKQAEAQKQAAEEQAKQAKLLEEQINKDIRPYINAYIDFSNGLYLVIKNIGKSTCKNFSMKITFEDNPAESKILAHLKEKIESYSYSILPSGVECLIPLGDKVFDYKHVLRIKTPLTVHFKFEFKGKTETFDNELCFDETQSHADSLIRNLNGITFQLRQISSELNSIRSSMH